MTPLLAWLTDVPTTNVRILATLVFVLGTAVRYLAFGVPTGGTGEGWNSWLIFLAVMAGIDASQYLGKRFSDTGYVAAKNANNQPDISVGGLSSVTVQPAPAVVQQPAPLVQQNGRSVQSPNGLPHARDESGE